ncbi:N-acetylneuraminate synthase [Adhaeribacter sp. BT258]|uniref:N-acetylneuraminate synthase n=1 Tax=Adhaeribacter terrigena TaxID=2793070 RepID=A0ABS1BZL1_9BACT|nr:N-acetylneuraminate synthase [Adhaeribacter terrigena]MBK0401705.1 N-acetylneuraminate synthase [Adhaeribacter terrigena]
MNRTLIIAEAGVNHNGSIELAKKLIDVAVEAGVDYVKFQTFKAENLVSKSAKKAAYQVKNINDNDDSQFAMLKKLELDIDTHKLLIDYCQSRNIKFLSTAFDLDSIDLLNELNIDLFKVPSGEITNYPYLQKIGRSGKSVIVSTGMANLSDIEACIEVLTNAGTNRDQVTILHCNTEYPTPMKDVNLKAMLTIGEAFKVPVGYSDHTLGIEIPVAAVAMGATVIEKHFTLDKTMEGPDHKASLEPDELIKMVAAIRNIENAMGNGIKSPSASEARNIEIARKSIHIAKDLPAGHTLTEADLLMKRPGSGISPMKINSILGKTIAVSLREDDILSWSHLQ